MNYFEIGKVNIYLDEERKSNYMEDFAKLLEFERDFWGLDNGVKDILIKINKNNFLYTLYSKRKQFNNPNSDDDSYLKFCYCIDIEQLLFRYVIPYFIFEYNNSVHESICYYEFYPPKINHNYSEDSESFGLKCIDDKDYFYINLIGK